MASSIATILDHDSFGDSDYGSEFSAGEEDIVNQLLENIGNNTASPSQPYSTTSSPPPVALPFQANAKLAGNLPITSRPLDQKDQHHVPGFRTRSESASPNETNDSPTHCAQPRNKPISRAPSSMPPWGSVQYPDLSRALSRAESGASPPFVPASQPSESLNDSRSPLQRFRSFPKKPLTVTDLSSGAWCELQYWYTLSLLPGGRKTRTAAMRGGTRIHQTLEDQVHTTIPVNVNNKEEAFALRLWNVIQGLRTLRDSGMTRELEVWGIIEGQIVNGIVDELSHESPNADFEQELNLSQESGDVPTTRSGQQASVTKFFEPRRKRVYLTDVKTRASERLPAGAALRPARVQLFLYHRLLGEMASGVVDFATILDRYGLRADASFSDAFMAQVGDLHDEIFYDADSDIGEASSSPRSRPNSSAGRATPPTEFIRYRSIIQLIPLLRSELHSTFPQGAATLGDLLAVQYRHRDDGRILGNNSFPNDPEALEGYIRQNLQWWRGERDAEGVSIEETYKCRPCEFAESCQWRKDKEAELLQKKRGAVRV
ncbi:exonuclease V [Hypoxylon sp. NC1633]|nr:exonuclease V [Hypoxylon sp. NC1633]